VFKVVLTAATTNGTNTKYSCSAEISSKSGNINRSYIIVGRSKWPDCYSSLIAINFLHVQVLLYFVTFSVIVKAIKVYAVSVQHCCKTTYSF